MAFGAVAVKEAFGAHKAFVQVIGATAWRNKNKHQVQLYGLNGFGALSNGRPAAGLLDAFFALSSLAQRPRALRDRIDGSQGMVSWIASIAASPVHRVLWLRLLPII